MMNDNYLFGQYVAACYGMNYIETKMYQFGILHYLFKSPLIQLGPACCNTYMEPTDPKLKYCWENTKEEFEMPTYITPN